MARNEEKQFCRLNRMILQQQKEEETKKNPKRPSLHSLSTAAEIKYWLPSIKKDIDFYLKQSKVWCYPERKITEFNGEIDRLRREHQAYVWRLRQLEPTLTVLPGTDRPYSTKTTPCTNPTDVAQELQDQTEASAPSIDPHPTPPPRKKFKRIPLPILHSPIEQQYAEEAKCKTHELSNLTDIVRVISEDVTRNPSDNGDTSCEGLLQDTHCYNTELPNPHWPPAPSLHHQDAPLDFRSGNTCTLNNAKQQDPYDQQTIVSSSNGHLQGGGGAAKDSSDINKASSSRCNVLGLNYKGSSSEDEEENKDNA